MRRALHASFAVATPFLRGRISLFPLTDASAHSSKRVCRVFCASSMSKATTTPTTTTTTATGNTAAPSIENAPPPPEDVIVQYIVVRKDLLSTWATGSVIAQAVHAGIAAVWASREEASTVEYCSQAGNGNGGVVSDQMHSVVLEAKNEEALNKLAHRLAENEIQFALWKEQPEDFVTALAAWPYARSKVKKHFGKFKLFK